MHSSDSLNAEQGEMVRVHKAVRLEAENPAELSLNSEVWILVLVLVVVLDQSAFSAAKRARLSRNYFVQLV